MPLVSEIMSPDVRLIDPQATLQEAAQMMLELDVGSLPVCQGTMLLGMVTDRDITIRGVAAGLLPATAKVSEVMTADLQFCTEDQDTEDVMRLMGESQVRRLPVVNMAKQLVGIVSLGDMALRQVGHIDQTVREIVDPGIAPLAPSKPSADIRS